jgi:tetratricopeptide (TPR) repeat protein
MNKPFHGNQAGWQILFAQATSHHQAGELSKALQCYQEILRQVPRHSDALHLAGIILADQGRLQEGLDHVDCAIAISPSFPPYYLNRGLIYKRLKQFDLAIKDFNKALSLGYKNLQLFCNLGHASLEKKDYSAAEAHYRKALDLHADSAETLSNLGIALTMQNKIDEAIGYCQKAIAAKSGFIKAYINLGIAYNHAYRFDEAETIYQKALGLSQDNADVYEVQLNRGVNYRSQNQIEFALECFRKAAAIKPTPETEFNEAIGLLLLGDYKNGWQKYLARLTIKDRANDLVYPQPLWQGEDLAGKSLLIHAEQGLGDTIQFFRYMKLFPNTVHIFFACQKELIPLLTPYVNNIFPRRVPEQHFDYQVPIMNLAMRFKTNSIDEIPFSEGYIKSPPSCLDGLLKDKRFKVGLVWAGNKQNPHDHHRTIPVAMFKDLLEVKNIRFYSLQWGVCVKEIESQNFQEKLFDTSSEIKDLADTAALVSQLDLLITVDTAIAHLAGAMAKPTWVLLQFAPDFRWLLERKDSPWYKSVRLFRQKQAGDWQEVLQEVKKELEDIIRVKV